MPLYTVNTGFSRTKAFDTIACRLLIRRDLESGGQATVGGREEPLELTDLFGTEAEADPEMDYGQN